MPYVLEDWMKVDAIGGCPDCGNASQVDEKYNECDAKEELADENIMLFIQCGTDFNVADVDNPTVGEIEALIDSGAIIAKKTEGFNMPDAEIQTRDQPYGPARPVAKIKSFNYLDYQKMETQEHRKQYNQVDAWAIQNRLSLGRITQNDELFLYLVKNGKNTTFSADDPQTTGENSTEGLVINASVKLPGTALPVPYRISGIYAAIAAKVNGVSIV